MRYAVFSDIHANLPALNAALDDARRMGVERFIFLGDYLFDFPWSSEVIDIVRSLPNATCIVGNKEGYIDWLAGQDKSTWIYDSMGVLYATYESLRLDQIEWIKSLPAEHTIELESGRKLRMLHNLRPLSEPGPTIYSSSGEYARQYRRRPKDPDVYQLGYAKHVKKFMSAYIMSDPVDVIAYGHNHMYQHTRCCGTLILNPGSVGVPLDGRPGAPYALLDDMPKRIMLTERRPQYDINGTIGEALRHPISQRGRIWAELCCLSAKRALEYCSLQLNLAQKLATIRGEHGKHISNETWAAAYERLRRDID